MYLQIDRQIDICIYLYKNNIYIYIYIYIYINISFNCITTFKYIQIQDYIAPLYRLPLLQPLPHGKVKPAPGPIYIYTYMHICKSICLYIYIAGRPVSSFFMSASSAREGETGPGARLVLPGLAGWLRHPVVRVSSWSFGTLLPPAGTLMNTYLYR